MRSLILIAFILQAFFLFSQDIIVTVDKQVIYSKVFSSDTDIIQYRLYDDASAVMQTIPKSEVIGIEYEDGGELLMQKVNLRKEIINITRTNKRGWHVAYNTLVSSGDGYYDRYNLFEQEFGAPYEYGYNESNVFSIQQSINLKYYINNVFGFTAGYGYNLTKYRVQSFDDNSYIGEYQLENVVLPFRAFISPGNKFGFYLEGGFTLKIPVSAQYEDSYYKNRIRVEGSGDFIREIDPLSAFMTIMVGFHTTIDERVIIYGGPTFLTNITDNSYTSSNGSMNYGFKLSISTHLSVKEK